MSKETILVVEDEEDILELLRYNLAKEGYKVICAASGEAALEKASSESIDLIVLDLMLPGIDGPAVTRKLKDATRTRNIPIVMLTAKGEALDIVTGLELGADDYPVTDRSVDVQIVGLRKKLGTYGTYIETVRG